MLRKLDVSGFRGIRHRQTLDFGKDGASMVVFGENGKGKSSIADAWEWLVTGKIDHLGVEGAQEGSYPHRDAKDGDTWVEAEFKDPELGIIRRRFNPKAVKKPVSTGKATVLEQRATFRVRLRHSDLAEFVFEQKGKRYEKLADLMGLAEEEKPVKALEKVLRAFEAETESAELSLGRESGLLKTLLGQPSDQVARVLADRLKAIGIKVALTDVDKGVAELRKTMESEAPTSRVPRLVSLKTTMQGVAPETANEALDAALTKARSLLAELPSTTDLHRIGILEQGAEHLRGGGDDGICPLCGQPFKGGLLGHIERELARLEKIKAHVTSTTAARDAAVEEVRHLGSRLQALLRLLAAGPKGKDAPADEERLRTTTEEAATAVKAVGEALSKQGASLPSKASVSGGEKLREGLGKAMDRWKAESTSLADAWAKEEAAFGQGTKKRIELLEFVAQVKEKEARVLERQKEVEARRKLVAATTAVSKGLRLQQRAAVNQRFGEISTEVGLCFSILEKRDPGLSKPRLRLAEAEDKQGVVLDVDFYTSKSPLAIQSVLSESQLNSFALSVFLACLRRFQKQLQVMVLDDVVTSFDAAKRSLVIDLLRERFSDFQIILMTHDQVFFTRIKDALQKWRHLKIDSWSYAGGPQIGLDPTEVEQAKAELGKGKPVEAAQRLGRYLERCLGEICAGLRGSVPYKPDNTYTLADFSDAVPSALKDALGKDHALTKAFQRVKEVLSARNDASHWKDSSAAWTTPEVEDLHERWTTFESAYRCPDKDKCGRLPVWTEKQPVLTCRCGKRSERKAEPPGRG